MRTTIDKLIDFEVYVITLTLVTTAIIFCLALFIYALEL